MAAPFYEADLEGVPLPLLELDEVRDLRFPRSEETARRVIAPSNHCHAVAFVKAGRVLVQPDRGDVIPKDVEAVLARFRRYKVPTLFFAVIFICSGAVLTAGKSIRVPCATLCRAKFEGVAVA